MVNDNVIKAKEKFGALLFHLVDEGFTSEHISFVLIHDPFFLCFEKNDINGFLETSIEEIIERCVIHKQNKGGLYLVQLPPVNMKSLSSPSPKPCSLQRDAVPGALRSHIFFLEFLKHIPSRTSYGLLVLSIESGHMSSTKAVPKDRSV